MFIFQRRRGELRRFNEGLNPSPLCLKQYSFRSPLIIGGGRRAGGYFIERVSIFQIRITGSDACICYNVDKAERV